MTLILVLMFVCLKLWAGVLDVRTVSREVRKELTKWVAGRTSPAERPRGGRRMNCSELLLAINDVLLLTLFSAELGARMGCGYTDDVAGRRHERTSSHCRRFRDITCDGGYIESSRLRRSGGLPFVRACHSAEVRGGGIGCFLR